MSVAISTLKSLLKNSSLTGASIATIEKYSFLSLAAGAAAFFGIAYFWGKDFLSLILNRLKAFRSPPLNVQRPADHPVADRVKLNLPLTLIRQPKIDVTQSEVDLQKYQTLYKDLESTRTLFRQEWKKLLEVHREFYQTYKEHPLAALDIASAEDYSLFERHYDLDIKVDHKIHLLSIITQIGELKELNPLSDECQRLNKLTSGTYQNILNKMTTGPALERAKKAIENLIKSEKEIQDLIARMRRKISEYDSIRLAINDEFQERLPKCEQQGVTTTKNAEGSTKLVSLSMSRSASGVFRFLDEDNDTAASRPEVTVTQREQRSSPNFRN